MIPQILKSFGIFSVDRIIRKKHSILVVSGSNQVAFHGKTAEDIVSLYSGVIVR